MALAIVDMIPPGGHISKGRGSRGATVERLDTGRPGKACERKGKLNGNVGST
jgi:hypothetical protein